MDFQTGAGDGMIVRLPAVSISTEGLGSLDNVTITNIVLSGSIFSQGTGSITFFEKAKDGKFYNVSDMGGKWTISFDGQNIWTGYVMEVNSNRLGKIMKRSISLVDQTEAWDVLVKDKIYPASADSGYTVGDLISDLSIDAANASGVPIDVIPDNSTTLDSVLSAGRYTIRSSTYLAEIQKVLTWVGYKLYADPFSGKISIIDPNNTPTTGALNVSFNSDNLLSASFDIKYGDIATTVVVGDDVSGKAVAYGHLASTSDNTNFNLRKIEKVAFVTTYGVKDSQLSSIAESVYNLSRRGGQLLKVTVAGYYPQSLLWNSVDWADANNNSGSYKVSGYSIEVSPSSISTTIEAVL